MEDNKSKSPYKSQEEFDNAWKNTKPGQKIIGLDGKQYTKPGVPEKNDEKKEKAVTENTANVAAEDQSSTDLVSGNGSSDYQKSNFKKDIKISNIVCDDISFKEFESGDEEIVLETLQKRYKWLEFDEPIIYKGKLQGQNRDVIQITNPTTGQTADFDLGTNYNKERYQDVLSPKESYDNMLSWINDQRFDKEGLPIRTQEQILRDSGYPKDNRVPDNFWGLKPPL